MDAKKGYWTFSLHITYVHIKYNLGFRSRLRASLLDWVTESRWCERHFILFKVESLAYSRLSLIAFQLLLYTQTYYILNAVATPQWSLGCLPCSLSGLPITCSSTINLIKRFLSVCKWMFREQSSASNRSSLWQNFTIPSDDDDRPRTDRFEVN